MLMIVSSETTEPTLMKNFIVPLSTVVLLAAAHPGVTAAQDGKDQVEVDHGETNCKTPDAASYIRKSRER